MKKSFLLLLATTAVGFLGCKPVGELLSDFSPPSGPGISINGGASVTNSTIVTLSLQAVDAEQMYISNSGNCSGAGSWEAFNSSKSWTIGSTNSTATVSVKYRDKSENVSACVSDSIVHDSVGPDFSAKSVNPASPSNDTTPTANFTLSEAATVTLYSNSTCASALSAATSKPSGAQTLDTNTLSTNQTYTIYAKGVDVAGNASACTSIGSYTLDTTPPSLSGGSLLTASPGSDTTPEVQFTLSGGNAIVSLYLTDCSGTAIATSASLANGVNSLTTSALSGDGSKVIVAKAVDTAGNASSCEPISTYVLDTTAPSITNITSTLGSNGTYGVGAMIPVQVVFSEPVNVTGTPKLTLETGTTDAVVNYVSGSPGNTLVFEYTVAGGESASPLDASSLATNDGTNGTIQDSALNNATLSLPAGSLGTNKNLTIETTQPTITSINSPKLDGTYGLGAKIPVQVVFSEAVAVTGTPTLTLETGATDAEVNYSSGSGTSTLVFEYTVAAGQSSLDLTANSLAGTIKDLNGNNAVLTVPSAPNNLADNKALVIDVTAPPTVNSVTSLKANGTYTTGEAIEIQVEFSESVDVSGTPQIILNTSVSGTPATYLSGTGSSTLVFEYTVIPGDTSSDLDYKSGSPAAIDLNEGTIVKAGEPATAAVLSLVAPGDLGSLSANKALVIDTTAPTSPSLIINSGDVYATSSAVDLTLSASGNPSEMYITNTAGCASGGSWETYATSKLAWATTGANNSETVYVKFRDLAQNETACVSDSIIRVPEVLLVTAVKLPGDTEANGSYSLGDQIKVRVKFNTGISVTGSPYISLATGYSSGGNNRATCSETPATITLTDDTLDCTYTVAAGHSSADLDYTNTGALVGTINIKSGSTAALLTLPGVGTEFSLAGQKNIVINSAPLVTSVTSSANDEITYGVGTVIPIEVNFNQNVTVTGTPQITLETGFNDAVVNYSPGDSVGNKLVFNYTVAAGQHSTDLNYVNTSSLSLNGGTIKSAVGTPVNADLTLPATNSASSLGGSTNSETPALGTAKDIVIETAPQVVGVTTTTGDGPFRQGDDINIEVQFTGPVTVNTTGGTPYLELQTTSSPLAQAAYESNTGNSTLVFKYTVAPGQASSDLDYVDSNSLKLNGGTIKNGAQDALTTLASPGAAGSISYNEDVVVDPFPEVKNVTSSPLVSPLDGVKDVLEVVSIQVEFTEAVTVTGSPQLQLDTGPATFASCADIINSTTMNCSYTVAYGETSIGPNDSLRGRLEYTGTNALSGTIVDADETGGNALLALPTPGATGSLSANTEIRTLLAKSVPGGAADLGYGSAVAGAGDLDGNSRPEVIISAPLKNGIGTNLGEVYVIKDDGTILYTIAGTEDNAGFGNSVAGGFNVFNRPDEPEEKDYLVGAPNASGGGKVYLYEGETLLRTFSAAASGDQFGTSVALLGDLNEDGFSEIAIGAPGADEGGTNKGAVYIFDGDSGNELAVIPGSANNSGFGSAIANAGDVGGSLLNDLVIGAPNENANGAESGKVYVYTLSYSSPTLNYTLHWSMDGEAAGDHLGTSVAKAGFVDAGLVSDIIVGAPDHDASKGRAYVLNGSSGVALHTVTGDAAGDKLGYSVAGLGDRTDDGKAEFLVGAPFADGDGTPNSAQGIAQVFNGTDGTVIYTLKGANDGEHFGKVVAEVEGNIDDDGHNDFVVAAPDFNTDEGRGHYYR